MAGIFEILSGLATIILLLYYYLTRTFDYWKVRGVKGPRPIPFFGNVMDVMFQKKILAKYLEELCQTYKDEPYIGIFVRNTPILILKEPTLIKDVLIKDFTCFSERHTTVTKKASNFFNLVIIDRRNQRERRTTAVGSVILLFLFFFFNFSFFFFFLVPHSYTGRTIVATSLPSRGSKMETVKEQTLAGVYVRQTEGNVPVDS